MIKSKHHSKQEKLARARALVVRFRADGYYLPGKTVDEAAQLLYEQINKPVPLWKRALELLSFTGHLRSWKIRRLARQLIREECQIEA